MVIADLFLAAMLLAISAIDWRSRRIPDLLSLPLLAAGLAWNLCRGDEPILAYLAGAAAGYAVLAGVGSLHFRFRGREGLGLGDAKLFAAAGAWLGWRDLPLVLLAASLGGLAFALVRAWLAPARDREIAFGPWISLAIWLVWISGRQHP